MSELRPEDLGETPTLEVCVYRNGALVHRELCESEADAAAVAEGWEQEPGIKCEVADLSTGRHDVEDVEVEPTDVEAYPTAAEAGPGSERQW
jgi:hypothetical protein